MGCSVGRARERCAEKDVAFATLAGRGDPERVCATHAFDASDCVIEWDPGVCPGCGQRIATSGGKTECGGEGEGVCPSAAYAHDWAANLEGRPDWDGDADGPPTGTACTEIVLAHEAAWAAREPKPAPPATIVRPLAVDSNYMLGWLCSTLADHGYEAQVDLGAGRVTVRKRKPPEAGLVLHVETQEPLNVLMAFYCGAVPKAVTT